MPSARPKPIFLLLACALALLLGACAPLPERATIPTRWVASPSFNERKVGFVVIHYTASRAMARALRTLTDRRSEVSAHYLIGRDGEIVQLVDERKRAWHAGESRWGATVDVNSASIGIELDNDGQEPFAEPQIGALLSLLADIRTRHQVPAANVLGHADVAPTRKSDPGARFPWATLAAYGFGLWCARPWPAAPPGFDAWLALRAIGYDTRDAAAALRAFRLHFRPEAPADAPIELDAALIQCLLQDSLGVAVPAGAASEPSEL